MATQLSDASRSLARQAREQFVAYAQGGLIPLAEAIRAELNERALGTGSVSERQSCRELLESFEAVRIGWVEATTSAWRAAARTPASRAREDSGVLELMGDDVFEQKILASRLAHAITERVSGDFNDLKLRMQHIENDEELAPDDVLRPESAAQLLVEQWTSVGLTRDGWLQVQEVIRQHMAERLLGAYQRSNAALVAAGVLPEIDLAARVRRSSGRTEGASGRGPDSASAGLGPDSRRSGDGGSRASRLGPNSSGSGVGDETRLMTGASPLARARLRASGVLGQLKRMLSDRVGSAGTDGSAGPSPALAAALAEDATRVQTSTQQEFMVTGVNSALYDVAAVERIAGELRQRSSDIKARASTSAEKATIEIVALMFQSILAEDRIPPVVRVWFARLQMPVLRVALAEPEFFGTMEHPARQLIDRLGSCVMGFDSVEIGGSALEGEIKRVVQVIEQYPETGRRVFQLVYDEFQKFLSRYLTEKGTTQRLVSVAQQVEQKETMAIQYTIEMRNMLNDIPVRDEIREFLFKVWAEVLAIAAVKHGPQHADTVALKKSAADLVWAASAKPQKSDRARVIQDLPALLQRLRQGMTLLGLPMAIQEAHIKGLGDTLADAFQSKTDSIPQALIESLAERLAHLEDFVGEDPATDLPLDAQSIELLLGIDASAIDVVADDGQRASDAMLAWALELQLGNWFTLDHNSRVCQVQYVWASRRKQLHLFAMPDGKCFLIQVRRLASYLQSGLLLPTEEEALTVRATRDAIAKLNANPERLLT